MFAADAAPALARERIIRADQMDAICALFDHIRQMSGLQNWHLWQDAAIKDSYEWKRVRTLADEALRRLR